jgi:hypothetical protein
LIAIDRIWYIFYFLKLLKLLLNNWFSGSMQWETKLEGRIECTSAIVSDFSQVCIQLLSITRFYPFVLTCGISLGGCWMLLGKNLFSWFLEWTNLLDFSNIWWGILFFWNILVLTLLIFFSSCFEVLWCFCAAFRFPLV